MKPTKKGGIGNMTEQGELFRDGEIPALNPNPMVVRFGKHPEAKAYYKCTYRGNTNGPGTDHRVRWDAAASRLLGMSKGRIVRVEGPDYRLTGGKTS